MHSVDKVIDANEYSPDFMAVGYCDVCVNGLTSGVVKLQFKFPVSTELPVPTWMDFPNKTYASDTFESIRISEHGVLVRLLGVDNNNGVYVRIGRYLNK